MGSKDGKGSHLVKILIYKAIFVQPSLSVEWAGKFGRRWWSIFCFGFSKTSNRNVDRSTSNSGGERTDLTNGSKGITAWGLYSWFYVLILQIKLRLGMNYRSEIMMEAREMVMYFFFGDYQIWNCTNNKI